MTPSQAEADARRHDVGTSLTQKIGLWALTRYFLRLRTVRFGGPVASVGFMHRDLIEQRHWISEDTYKVSLTLAQTMPGGLSSTADHGWGVSNSRIDTLAACAARLNIIARHFGFT